MREALTTIGQPIAIPQAPDAPELIVSDGAIEIVGLHHHYGLERGGLGGVSLSIRPGEKIGQVGRSGAGKSTLVNLILRFFEAENGTITIDGQDIRHVDQDSLRAAVGMVAQQTALLNRSVRDNILLGRTDVSEEQLLAATSEARAFVHRRALRWQGTIGSGIYGPTMLADHRVAGVVYGALEIACLDFQGRALVVRSATCSAEPCAQSR